VGNIKLTEQRAHPRVPLCVAVTYGSAEEFFKEYTNNISAGGMFVETSRKVDYGTKILFRFRLPEIRGAIKGLGTVVRQQNKKNQVPLPKGFGIRFLTFHEESKEKLLQFLEKQAATPDKKKLMESI
jgi:uncharacterized protein (TIGR02266 family)